MFRTCDFGSRIQLNIKNVPVSTVITAQAILIQYKKGFLSLHKIIHSMQRPVETKSGLEYEYSTAKIIKIYQVPIQSNRTVMIRTYYFGSYSDTVENQEYDILDRNCAGNTDSLQTGFYSLHKHYPHSIQRPMETKSGFEYVTATSLKSIESQYSAG